MHILLGPEAHFLVVTWSIRTNHHHQIIIIRVCVVYILLFQSESE